MKMPTIGIKLVNPTVGLLKRGGGERSEPEPSGKSPTVAGSPPLPPLREPVDPEVPAKPCRKQYHRDYKLRILNEADSSTQPGQIGTLLRREGLYSSLLSCWRQQRECGKLDDLSSPKRGNDKKLRKRMSKLERKNRRLQKQLHQAEKIIDIQEKISEVLGIFLKNGERRETA